MTRLLIQFKQILFSGSIQVHCVQRKLENTVKCEAFYGYEVPLIHPFSIPAKAVGRVAGGLEPIPMVIGREAGYTLDRSPVGMKLLFL